jgi:diguanylate cyclase (GGDEF)-like protein/PAS domain S-box-containing protein
VNKTLKHWLETTPRRLDTLIVGALLLFNLFVLVFTSLVLMASRQQYEQRAYEMTDSTVDAVDRSLVGMVYSVDLALQGVVDELERELAQRRRDPRAINAVIARYQARVPAIEAIRVAAADGVVHYGKGVAEAGDPNWADRDYFRYLREHPAAGLQITSARLGRISKLPVVVFARSFRDPAGRFAGVVSAPIELATLQQMLSRFRLGEYGTVVLRDADLGLVVRHPQATGESYGQIGNRNVSVELRSRIAAGDLQGSFHTQSASDRHERIVAYRRVEATAMTIIASQRVDDYLAGWYAEARRALAGVLVFVLFSCAVGVLALRLLVRMQREGQRNRLYLLQASDGIHILDQHGKLVEASEQFCRMLGYERAELIGRCVTEWDVEWPADYLLNERFPLMLRQQLADPMETRHRRKDGSVIEVEISSVGFEADGERFLYAASRDIGERRRQQALLASQEARLRESEELYRQLLDNLPTGILHYDPQLKVTYTNRRFEEIMALPPGQVVGLDCHSLRDQGPMVALQAALAGEPGYFEGRYTATHSDRSLWASMSCAPVRDLDGQVTGGIAIIDDITERTESAALERRLRDSLISLNRIAASLHLPVAQQLQQALELGRSHFELAFAMLGEIGGTHYRIVAHVGTGEALYDGAAFDFVPSLCRLTFDGGEVLAIADLEQTGLDTHPCCAAFVPRAYIGAPLTVAGHGYGTVCFCAPTPFGREFDSADREFVGLLARWIGSVLEREQARQQLAASEASLQAIVDNEPECVMVVANDGTVLQMNRAGLAMLEVESVEEVNARGLLDFIAPESREAFVEFNRRVVRGENGALEFALVGAHGTRRWLDTHATPLRDQHGEITALLGVTRDMSAVRAHQQQLEFLAHYDALTKLPNRALLSDRMAQALVLSRRNHHLTAVCYLDLDGFKAINDAFGHEAGDALLVEVAQRLRDTVRASDTVARLGGDEFVLLLVGVESRDECERTVDRVLRALAAPIRLDDRECYVSGSIGITVFPDDDNDPDTLLRHADLAMYSAKQAGKNRHLRYDASGDHRALARRETARAVIEGLDGGEFQLHYQPIVDLRERRVLAFEGLLRWLHPQAGMLLPGEFLPNVIDSETGLVLERWVLSEGMRQLVQWRAAGITQRLALNVSGSYLLSSSFVEELGALLAAHPELDPAALSIEVLEATVVGETEALIGIFQRCRQLGVEMTIDDFGSGYSTLANFRRLPADTLKVDQSLVHSLLGNHDDLAVVDSVVALALAFKRKLIAEGIETPEVALLLMTLGCPVGQGFGIARPMPAAAVPHWLRQFDAESAQTPPPTIYSRDDIPLLLVQIDHRLWVKRFCDWLERPDDAPLPQLDPQACDFGRWLAGNDAQRYRQLDAFPAVLELHEQIHELARYFVDNCFDGRRDEMSGQLPAVFELRDLLLQRLQLLQEQVAAAKVAI